MENRKPEEIIEDTVEKLKLDDLDQVAGGESGKDIGPHNHRWEEWTFYNFVKRKVRARKCVFCEREEYYEDGVWIEKWEWHRLNYNLKQD